MPILVGCIAAILLLGLLLQALRQPHIIAYLFAGMILGPNGVGLVTDHATISRLGEIGVILLLFFVGMEISLPQLASRWKVPIFGTLLQIALSVGVIAIIGIGFGWAPSRIVLLGFVISMSSTAVVMKLLQSTGEIHDPIGRDLVGVLLAQDLAVVVMMIIVSSLGGVTPDPWRLALQVAGGIVAVLALGYVITRKSLRLPLGQRLRRDREMQVFAAALLCFGLALLSGLAGLSLALGAFIAGVIIGAARETEWIQQALFPFHVLFLALFFISIGMLIDFRFLAEHAGLLLALVAAVLVTNTLLNMVILRALGRTWPDALYGGAALSQIGEFSFLLAAVGLQVGLIGEFSYQTTILVIALSLLVSPTWIGLADRWRASRQAKPEQARKRKSKSKA